MIRRPVAHVRVLKLRRVHPEAVRVEVGCKHGTTGLTQVPGPMLALTRAQMVTAAVFEHEVRCGVCDTESAHARGDQQVRAMTDRVWDELMATSAATRSCGTARVASRCSG